MNETTLNNKKSTSFLDINELLEEKNSEISRAIDMIFKDFPFGEVEISRSELYGSFDPFDYEASVENERIYTKGHREKLVKEYKTKICCTRKTLPTLRAVQKYAVTLGGGTNNRFNLFDEIFIKDNHISASQNIFDLVQNALRLNRSGKVITVEVDNLTQLQTIQTLNFNRLLLDNMKPDEIKKALNMIGNKYETEASGNITDKNILDYARTGVNRISIGRLTHSPQNLDISLNFN